MDACDNGKSAIVYALLEIPEITDDAGPDADGTTGLAMSLAQGREDVASAILNKCRSGGEALALTADYARLKGDSLDKELKETLRAIKANNVESEAGVEMESEHSDIEADR